MPEPKVWTERETGGVGFTDCTWCSILMVLVGAGNEDWPLGIYTEAERKAFRGGDPRLNFSGGIAHAKSRYGIAIHTRPRFSQAELTTALGIPDRVFAVAGKLANFPAGHTLRRWQPSFLDFHAVAVRTRGNGTATWLDPLAPMRFTGDTVSVSDVAEIFARGNFPNDACFMELDEMARTTPGAKISGDPIGTFTFNGPGHALISPIDTRIHFPQADNASFSVFAVLDLKNFNGAAIDIEGNTPPLSGRDQVYLVDAPGFDNAAYALRGDGDFLPSEPAVPPPGNQADEPAAE